MNDNQPTQSARLMVLFDAVAECSGHHQLFDDSSPSAEATLRSWAESRHLPVVERPIESSRYDRIIEVELGHMRAVQVFCRRREQAA